MGTIYILGLFFVGACSYIVGYSKGLKAGSTCVCSTLTGD